MGILIIFGGACTSSLYGKQVESSSSLYQLQVFGSTSLYSLVCNKRLMGRCDETKAQRYWKQAALSVNKLWLVQSLQEKEQST